MSDTDSVWKSAENAIITADVSALERLLREHETMFRDQHPPSPGAGGLSPDYSGGDARSIMVLNHHFDSWSSFVGYTKARELEHSVVAQFEAAADAIVVGDVTTLDRLLDANTDLIRARSTRKHRSTLLHYVGANGVEYFRQHTPKNAVVVAGMLLAAGAEVDAEAAMYGGSTTLGLVATSVHPFLAGVQDTLMEVLLDHGAAVDGGFGEGNTGGYTHGAVNGCLANGRGEAAEFLAKRGARLGLDGAAGVGRLDVVKTFFSEDGTLTGNATQAELNSAFEWACGYGRREVVDFLLQMGFDPATRLRQHSETGLHCAAVGGHVDIVRLLLERHAPVDVRDKSFGGTPAGWALHGLHNRAAGTTADRYYSVVALLAAAGSNPGAEWLAYEAELGDPRLLAALRGEISEE